MRWREGGIGRGGIGGRTKSGLSTEGATDPKLCWLSERLGVKSSDWMIRRLSVMSGSYKEDAYASENWDAWLWDIVVRSIADKGNRNLQGWKQATKLIANFARHSYQSLSGCRYSLTMDWARRSITKWPTISIIESMIGLYYGSLAGSPWAARGLPAKNLDTHGQPAGGPSPFNFSSWSLSPVESRGGCSLLVCFVGP